MAAAIPAILKGDDSGAIELTMATGRSYVGATLVVAYQGVTRKFTNLNPGQTISFSFTHAETAAMTCKTAPVLMRLIGQYGAEETVENAEARIKVTDNLAEVNAGGSFTIKPGQAGSDPTKVPITDVGDLAARYTMAELKAKVDQIVRVLAQRSLLALAAAITLPFFASAAVQTARLDALYNDDLVVTNVTESGGVDTNAVVAISATQITNDVASWALKPNPAPVTDLTPAFAYTTAVSNKLEVSKQNVVEDLATIRSGAALGATAVQTEADPLSLHLADTNSFAAGILTKSGRDSAAKIADATNAVTKALTISTNGVAAAEYNGTAAVSLDITAGGGGVDPEQVKTIISEVFPSNRVFGVDGGLLTAYDVSADGVETNEIWREARGYAMTNGVWNVDQYDVGRWETRGLDGTITTITIGDAETAAAGVSVDLPSAWDAEARDFAVYVFNGAAVAAPLRLPTNATIYGYYANATNALKANAATALYFTEISRNTFLLGRAEITKVQEAAQ